MVRYVALGDSLTEGVGDPHPAYPNGLRGWADLLAAGLGRADPAAEYANLALRGKSTREVLQEQVGAAVALRPDLVTVWVGGNDLLRPVARPRPVLADLAATVEALRSRSEVLVLSAIRPTGSPLLRVLGGRVDDLDRGVRALCAALGVRCVDVSDPALWRERSAWAPDRVHPSASGHAVLAEVVGAALGLPVTTGSRGGELPGSPRGHGPGRAAALREEARWWATDVVPHLARWATRASRRETARPKWVRPVRPATDFPAGPGVRPASAILTG